jgi:hypothetical protein
VIDALRAGDEKVDRTLLVVRDQLPVVQARHDQPADAVVAGTVIVAALARAKPNGGADTRVILSYPCRAQCPSGPAIDVTSSAAGSFIVCTSCRAAR